MVFFNLKMWNMVIFPGQIYVTSGSSSAPRTGSYWLTMGYTVEGADESPGTCYYSKGTSGQYAYLDIPRSKVSRVKLLSYGMFSCKNSRENSWKVQKNAFRVERVQQRAERPNGFLLGNWDNPANGENFTWDPLVYPGMNAKNSSKQQCILKPCNF